MLAVDAHTQLPDDLLLLTDKMSMAVSLECRVPLLDHELVELAASMPQQVKMRGGRLKHVMKAALADVLPADILERKKARLRHADGRVAEGCAVAAAATAACRAESIERARTVPLSRRSPRLIDAHRRNRIDGTDRLLALLNLEIWARIYLDGRAPADVADELKAGAREDPVRLPPLPVSAEARRQDPAVQHDPAPARVARGDGRVARALGRGSEGRRGASRRIARTTRWSSSAIRSRWLRMVARLPTPSPSSIGFFHSPALARRIRALARERAFDLIFVHCSSVAHYVEDVAGIPKILDFGDMDSQKWLEYARYKPFPLSSATGSRARRWSRRRSVSRAASTSARRRRAPNGRRWRAIAPARRRTGFPNGVDSRLFRADRRAVRSRHDLVRRTHGLLPESGMHVRFLRASLAAAATRGVRDCKLLIVGADPSPAVRAPRAVSRRHGHRLRARRAAVPAPLGADGRAAQHRARHAEQDSRGHGDGRPGRREHASPPAASTPIARRALPRRADARGVRGRHHCASSSDPRRARIVSSRAGRARMLLASRLGALDAAPRRHHRALSRDARQRLRATMCSRVGMPRGHRRPREARARHVDA